MGGASEVLALIHLLVFEHIYLQSQGSGNTIAGLQSTVSRDTWVLSSALSALSLAIMFVSAESTD